MRPKLLAETIAAMHHINKTLYTVGPPGIGKTEIPRQVATKMGIGFVHIHAPMKCPEDMGFPVVSDDKMSVRFVVPEDMPVVGNDKYPEFGILLIDELGQSDASMQKVYGNIIQARELHGHKLKPGWSIVGTGNRMKDRAGVNRILSHLKDRMTEVELEVSLDDSTNHMLENGVNPIIIGYLRFQPDALHDFDPNRDQNATPRGWCTVSEFLGNVPDAALFELISGTVSEGRAATFKSFYDMYMKLPVPETVIMQADTYPVPTETSVKYALTGALAHRASPDNFDQILTFAKRMPAEFQTMLIIDAIKRCPAVQQTKGFLQWAANEGARIIL